ncbi:hypothetical protein BG005_001876 [Podila minutissima]|nr:hypothetical protein BG005_001876 [Podila minutissima]
MKFLTTFVTVAIASLAAVSADKIYWTQPSNNAEVYAGCPLELGYRVQYSDLAMLQWVQLQVLSSDGETVLADRIDNTTRDTWDAQNVRAKNVTWTVPGHWAPGPYILRAFGDSFYSCTKEGIRTWCLLELEDREIIQLKQLPEGASCESVQNTSASDPAPSDQSGVLNTMVNTSGGGTTGYSTPMHIVLDPAVFNVLNGTPAVAPESEGKEGATALLSETHQQDLAQKEQQRQQQRQHTAQADPGQIQDMSGMVPSGGGRFEVSMVLVAVVALVAGAVGQY